MIHVSKRNPDNKQEVNTMRVEYCIRITDQKGKRDFAVYNSRKYADPAFEKAKSFHIPKGHTVEYFKTYWVGRSFHHAEEI